MEIIISRQHTVQLSEVGPDSRLGPVVLMYFLQNIANEHAGLLGFGVEDLTARQIAWFARSHHIRIHSYPIWQQEITIRTWPSGKKRLLCLRDFEKVFTTRFGQLDLDRHINSAVYLSWAIETMPADFLWNHFSCEIEIAFLSELFFGKDVLAKTQLIQRDPMPVAIHLISDLDT